MISHIVNEGILNGNIYRYIAGNIRYNTVRNYSALTTNGSRYWKWWRHPFMKGYTAHCLPWLQTVSVAVTLFFWNSIRPAD